MMKSFPSETAFEGGGAVLYLTFTCLEVGAQKEGQVPELYFSTDYSMTYLCLHFCLKVAAELSLPVSARIINN